MLIRPAYLSDCSIMIRLMQQLGYSDTENFFPDKLGYLLKHPDYYILTAEEESQIVGFIVLHIVFELGLKDNTGLIAYLVVDENHRSKKIGECLEQEALLLSKRRNCTRIQLHCSSHRRDAHRFYIRLGYVKHPEYFSKAIN